MLGVRQISKGIHGFTLVELLILLGGLAAAALVGAQITQFMARSAQSMDARWSFQDSSNFIRNLIADPGGCQRTLKLAPGLEIDPTQVDGDYLLPALTVPAPGGLRDIVVSPDTPGQLDKAYLTEARVLTTGVQVSPGKYAAVLRITARKTPTQTTAVGAQTMSSVFNLVLIDSAPSDTFADACIGVADDKAATSELVVAQLEPADCLGSDIAPIQDCLRRLATAGGGSLLIKQGRYTGIKNLVIPANTRVRGEPGTVLSGKMGQTSDKMFDISANNVTLEGLTLDSGASTAQGWAMITVRGTRNVSIRENQFLNDASVGTNLAQMAILIEYANSTTVPQDNLLIEGNRFGSLELNGTAARRFKQGSQGIINIGSLGASVYARQTTIRHNLIVGNDSANAATDSSGELIRVIGPGTELNITENFFDSNRPCVLIGSAGAHAFGSISNNQFQRCFKGVYIEGAFTSGLTVQGNSFTNVEDGILLRSSIQGAAISSNKISCRTPPGLLDDVIGGSNLSSYGIHLNGALAGASVSGNSINNCRFGMETAGVTTRGLLITANHIVGAPSSTSGTWYSVGIRVGSDTSVSSNTISNVQVGIWQARTASGLTATGNLISGEVIGSTSPRMSCHTTLPNRKVGICASAGNGLITGNRIYDMNVGFALHTIPSSSQAKALVTANTAWGSEIANDMSGDYYGGSGSLLWTQGPQGNFVKP